MKVNKTLKTIFFTLLFFSISSSLFHFDASATATRPYYGWTRVTGGNSADPGTDLEVDSNKNYYIAGTFQSTNMEFNTTGSGASDVRSSAGSDIFITKYSSDNSYIWTRVIGGGSGDFVQGMTIDSSDNLYIVGQFQGSNVQFNTTGSGPSDIRSSLGGNDMFVTKYNSDGSYAWTRVIGSSGNELPQTITANPDGDIFFSGQFNGTNVQFNTTGSGSSDIRSTTGGNDIFLTKYNSDGTYGWTRTVGGSGNDIGTALTTSVDGELYLAGNFQSANVEFNTTGSGASDVRSTAGLGDIYLTKFNSDDSYGWTRVIGGTASDLPVSVKLDFEQNLYLVGVFQSTNVNFNTTGAGSSDIHSSAGVQDAFILKYNSDESYSWTRTIGGTDIDNGIAVETNTTGDIYFAGSFRSTNLEFNTTGSGASETYSSAGLNDVFLTKYNYDGSYAWTRAFGGTLTDGISEFALIGENIYLMGTYQSTSINFNTTGFGSDDIKSNAGSTDFYFLKYVEAEIAINLLESGVTSNENIAVMENGAAVSYELVLTAEPSDDVTITLSYGSGITVSSSTLTFTPSNWNIPQTITISAVNDSIASGNRSVTISHTVTSNDSLYNGIPVPHMTVNIIEDDSQTTSTGKKASVGAGVGIGNGTDAEVELEEESEFTITPTPTKTAKPSSLPETGKNGEVKGSGIKFTQVAICSFPLIIIVVIMIIAAKRKKKQNEN